MVLEPERRFDLDAIKRDANLLDIVGRDTELRKESATDGGSYKGRCPFCGGTDRLVVRPNGRTSHPNPTWWCRICTGEDKPQSAIDYVMRRDRLDFKAAAAWLAEQTGNDRAWTPAELDAQRETIKAQAAASREREAAARETARAAMDQAYREQEFRTRLEQHADVVASLEADGIPRWAQEQFRFGFSIKSHRGIQHPALTLPWYLSEDQLEVVQYRLLDVVTHDNKYLWTTGLPAGTFWNGTAVREPDKSRLIICEGAKKGATVYSTGIHCDFGVTAVHNNSSAPGRMNSHKEQLETFDRVYVILDPGSERKAVEAARRLENGYVVFLPDKVDEWLVARGCDAYALLAVIENARKP